MDSTGSGCAYTSCADATRLFQGEILSNVVERGVRWTGRDEHGGDDFGLAEVVHPYAVIVTQDCDLEQHAAARATPKPKETSLVPAVLLVVASLFEAARGQFPGSDVRKRAKQNKDDRYQFLAAMPPEADATGSGIEPLLLDFKRVFSYPTDQLLGSIERGEAMRRGRLVTPFAEHLSSRFGFFMARVGLPIDHHRF